MEPKNIFVATIKSYIKHSRTTFLGEKLNIGPENAEYEEIFKPNRKGITLKPTYLNLHWILSSTHKLHA